MTRTIDGISQAGSIRINQEVADLRRAGKDVTVLSLERRHSSISRCSTSGALDFTLGYHYSDSRGLPSLRGRIADVYSARYGVPASGDKKTCSSRPARRPASTSR